MLIPWNTDAPIYHFPFATIGLIVVNALVFFAVPHEEMEPYLLIFGEGLHPLQWITSVFLHADFMHLAGNMIFLWAFGLIVEGKLGWSRFLLVYLGLGVIESAVVQVAMLGGDGAALGASGAIYGLLAIALIWAPRNSVSCFLFLGVRPITFDAPIVGFVSFYVAWELVSAWLGDFEISSAMLHLAGAVPGFIIGTVLLTLGLVDCENWDVFALLQNRVGESKDAGKKREEAAAKKVRVAAAKENKIVARRAVAGEAFASNLAEGRFAEAAALHLKMSEADAAWQLSGEQQLALIKGLHSQKQWSASVPHMVHYLRSAPANAPQVRLKLAQILLVHEQRPGKALNLLEKIPVGSLSPNLEQTRQQLKAQAQRQYDAAGEIEVEGEGW